MKEQKIKFNKKLPKISFKQNITFFATCLSLIYLLEEESTTIKYLYDQLTPISSTTQEDLLSITEFIESLNNNPNLSKNEILSILRLTEEINNSTTYLNENELTERLSSLEINYSKGTNDNTGGIYNKNTNKIDFFINNTDSKFTSDEILYHEYAHLLTNYNKTWITEQALLELTNQLFTKEYSYTECVGYKDLMPIIYTLSEILPEEKIKEYRYNPQIKIIIDELLLLDNNYFQAESLITNINKLFKEYINSSSAKELTNNELILDVLEDLNHYYKKKHNEDMINNPEISLYFYDTIFETKETKNTLLEYAKTYITDLNQNIEPIIVSKGYKGHVSPTYKEKMPNSFYEINYTTTKGTNKLELITINNNQFQKTYTK